MIDLKERKSDWSATSTKGGQFESAETGHFGRRVQLITLIHQNEIHVYALCKPFYTYQL